MLKASSFLMLKEYPEMISRSCFIDPVVFEGGNKVLTWTSTHNS